MSKCTTIEDVITQLRREGKGYQSIAIALQAQFPEMNLSTTAWRSRAVRYIKKHENDINVTDASTSTSEITNKHSIERKADGSYIYESIIEVFKDEDITPDTMLKAHKLSAKDWEVVSYKNNFWSQQSKGGKTVVLYQSKLIVKPRQFDNIAESVVLEHFMQKAKRKYPMANMIEGDITNPKNPKMLEINICDLHLGKLAFDSISGDTYNYKIARERFFNLINAEYSRAKEYNVEKILFVWSNDFFNTDGISNSTTRGTPQQTAIAWQNLFLEGVSMLVDAIELFASIAQVKSFYISSNHSRQADFYALCYLQAWFRNDANVQIVNNKKSRYYERYGVVLLGFSHSYYEKESNLYHLMATECPEDWADTTYREFHLAHYHSEKVKDVGGVVYRWLPTVCGTDEYHYDSGYVGSVKRSYSFLYDKCKGLIQMNCNII